MQKPIKQLTLIDIVKPNWYTVPGLSAVTVQDYQTAYLAYPHSCVCINERQLRVRGAFFFFFFREIPPFVKLFKLQDIRRGRFYFVSFSSAVRGVSLCWNTCVIYTTQFSVCLKIQLLEFSVTINALTPPHCKNNGVKFNTNTTKMDLSQS